jgi:hypothetical protein
LTVPRTLYYCLGNIGENSGSIRSIQQDLRGNLPFASGLVLVHAIGTSELVIPQARAQEEQTGGPDNNDNDSSHDP